VSRLGQNHCRDVLSARPLVRSAARAKVGGRSPRRGKGGRPLGRPVCHLAVIDGARGRRIAPVRSCSVLFRALWWPMPEPDGAADARAPRRSPRVHRPGANERWPFGESAVGRVDGVDRRLGMRAPNVLSASATQQISRELSRGGCRARFVLSPRRRVGYASQILRNPRPQTLAQATTKSGVPV
jgi:hypothetical protein